MSKPIKIEYLAEVSKYLSETKKIAVSQEDLADALVATSHDAEDLERKLSRAMRDSAKDVETLERAVKDVPKATEEMADKAAQDFNRIEASAGDAGRETAQEFKQNLGQTLASGGGPLELITETMGGLVAGLAGPVGIAAAVVAGGAAIAFNQIKEEGELVKAYLDGLRTNLESLYTQGVENATKLERLDAFTKFVDESKDKTKEWADEMDQVGVGMEDFLFAAFEGGPALDEMRRHLEDMADDTGQFVDEYGVLQEYPKGYVNAAKDILGLLNDEAAVQEQIRLEQEGIASAAKYYADYVGLADTNLDGVIDDTDLVNTKMDDAVDKVKDLGTGNTAMDDLVDKADEIGWNALTAKEQAALIGSGNTALKPLVDAMAQMKADARGVNTYLNDVPTEIKVSIVRSDGGISGVASDQARAYQQSNPYATTGRAGR